MIMEVWCRCIPLVMWKYAQDLSITLDADIFVDEERQEIAV